MAHCNSILSQLVKLLPRHEFEKLANDTDGPRKSSALSRWSQFLSLSVGHMTGRQSLRDIEHCMSSHHSAHYHLGCQSISKSSLARANQNLSYEFYLKLFQTLYTRCSTSAPNHKFHFANKLFSLDGTLFDASMKLFPWADYNRKKSAFKLHVGLDHDGLIPAFASITHGSASEVDEAKAFAFPKVQSWYLIGATITITGMKLLQIKEFTGLDAFEAAVIIEYLKGRK